MKIDPVFHPAFEVIERIEQAGGEAFVVGGSVRDFISGRPIGDIDIATSEPPQRIQEIFDKVIPVGIEHGTVIVRHQSVSYEVTTYRTEKGYEDYRHPDEVTFVRDIAIDLARRDFTMNAIAMDRCGNFIDPYEGRIAIQNKTIEAVGDPFHRFREDPLRMMRAIRFSSQLSFTLDASTKEALDAESALLAYISIERIAVEVQKMYAGKGFRNGLELLTETRLHHQLPIINQFDLSELAPSVPLQHWHELLAYFITLDEKLSLDHFVKRWKLSNSTKRQAGSLLKAVEAYEEHRDVTAWLVYRLPAELFDSFARLLQALGQVEEDLKSIIEQKRKQLPVQRRKEITFQAEDLIALYPDIRKGPWISKAMEQIEYEIIKENIENDYEKIKEWVLAWNPPVNN
ncbi:CCA tRNA nucleotidyltransferase [Halobacillus litoralis]|uniref:CCA-adding enzyme n=1 Tax=Halobacillus litoralis TaxID=45668 RepID=A0A410M825_9BACI|nr:CCA tRNA nucleotidyltransferase [Halobacillus litoralis]QAS50803.1 CCA tRNA nucleotidyltransferase [Halobacillus litoralis]